MNRAPTGGLVGRAVDEAIGAFAAPKIRAAVVELALRWARLEGVPERGEAVGSFVEGALFHAAEQMLGAESAEAIKSDLAPMIAMVRDQEVSAVRPSAPPPVDSDYPEIEVDEPSPARTTPPRGRRPWLATAPEPLELRTVLVASMDPSSVGEMSRWLAGTALVEPVRDALDVLSHLDATECELVVVDCRRPAVSVETLVALAPEMPKDSRAVLWGERHDLEQHLERLGAPFPTEWVCCGPAATAEDVAAVVRILLE